MEHMTGRPNTIKQVNLTAIRKSIKEKGSATRAEIVESTNISVTTVRNILTEMLNTGEIIEAGFDESIGGRRAVRYKLKKDKFFGAAFCIGNDAIHYLTVDICGEIYEKGTITVENDIFESMCSFLDKLIERLEIKSIGIGVPGIVNGMTYQKKNTDGEMETYSIGELVKKRYGVPVILENDINAVALGFGRCYLKQYPKEKCENINMAYIHFGKKCLSAGFLSEGRILRGWHNFAGELGLFPAEGTETLDEILASAPEDSEYAKITAKIIGIICCVLNPQYIAVGGENFRKECLSSIIESVRGVLPDKMSAEIVYAEDKWHDYYEGMAYLTAEHIFADVSIVKEKV